MEKNLKNIEVVTLANGYSLRFDGMEQSRGYMYFSLEKLIEGIMLHIGLNITHQLEVNDMSDFLKAAENWNENKECVEEIRRLNSEVDSIKFKYEILMRRLMRERESVIKVGEEFKNAIDIEDKEKKKKRFDAIIKKCLRKRPISQKSISLDAINIDDENESNEE